MLSCPMKRACLSSLPHPSRTPQDPTAAPCPPTTQKGSTSIPQPPHSPSPARTGPQPSAEKFAREKEAFRSSPGSAAELLTENKVVFTVGFFSVAGSEVGAEPGGDGESRNAKWQERAGGMPLPSHVLPKKPLGREGGRLVRLREERGEERRGEKQSERGSECRGGQQQEMTQKLHQAPIQTWPLTWKKREAIWLGGGGRGEKRNFSPSLASLKICWLEKK